MDSSESSCLAATEPQEASENLQNPLGAVTKRISRCPDLIAFLAICFQHDSDVSVDFYPFLLNKDPGFDDASMGGGSLCHVRKVRTSTCPPGLKKDILKNREFVIAKHPRVPGDAIENGDMYSDMATELQILRHGPIRKHENVVDLLAIAYFDAGEYGNSHILPALVLEYPELGSVQSYQKQGYARSIEDKLDILIDAARGVQALHECGIIHGDLKPSNLVVCKDATRKFVVKLRGFDYSSTANEDHVVGTPRYLEAPEAIQTLDRRFIHQLDIYSFGLLIFTVFNNGKHFYESTNVKDRDQIRGLKASGLPAVATQISLLQSMKDEEFPLFTICKILAYSLQPNPAHRPATIGRVLTYLQSSDPRLLPAVSTASASRRVRGLRGPSQHQRKAVRDFARRLTNSYCSSFAARGLQMPSVKTLKKEMLARIYARSATLATSHKASGLEPNASATLSLFRECMGLLDESMRLGFSSLSTNSGDLQSLGVAQFQFSRPSIPDFSRISVTLQKMHPCIQTAIFANLLKVCDAENEESRKSLAHLGLACLYTNGIGTDFSLEDAAAQVMEAAKLDHTGAQFLYVDVFSELLGNRSEPDNPTLVEWCFNSALPGNKQSLKKLRDCSGTEYSERLRRLRLQGSFVDCFECRNRRAPGEECGCHHLLDWISWRHSFIRFAIINDMPPLLESLLETSPHLVDQSFPCGDTPLSLACRYGNAVITKELLRRGADPKIHGNFAITPLHWLVSFEEDEHLYIASRLLECGADVNAISNTGNTAVIRSVYDTPLSGTPLHWAVAQNDLSAVRVLLRLGADITIEFPANSPTAGFNVFEYACSLARYTVLKLFIENDIGKALVDAFHTLKVEDSVTVRCRPHFVVLGTKTRLQRLLHSGVGFEHSMRETIRLLSGSKKPYDCVLKADDLSMSAIFATAFHHCNADVMKSCLELGFDDQIDSTFGLESSRGNALCLAITYGDRDMFSTLLAHGANIWAQDKHFMTPLVRAARESDDVFFVDELLKAGVPVDPTDNVGIQTFYMAVYSGNLKVARFLFEMGADRDWMPTSYPMTALGAMIWRHTRNAAKRVEFLLSLPNRGSDGFMASRFKSAASALHMAATRFSEDRHNMEITTAMISMLLSKYRKTKYLDSTSGPDRSTVLGMAVEAGNYEVVQLLLGQGADPNIRDAYGRTPLDKLHWRYCYPHRTPELANLSDAEIEDRLLVERKFTYVDRDTSKILSLLTKYNAKANVFHL
ncbi:ankyrin [Rhizodiscina lignyota]|uniref:Ankyrin n=1 Tax=Rhizodiscina lignyota TaxID=1504668 RepID=A0A9P4M2H8_9PEZI|nr:ankyrin [Rhizodiscina lignyota]